MTIHVQYMMCELKWIDGEWAVCDTWCVMNCELGPICVKHDVVIMSSWIFIIWLMCVMEFMNIIIHEYLNYIIDEYSIMYRGHSYDSHVTCSLFAMYKY